MHGSLGVLGRKRRAVFCNEINNQYWISFAHESFDNASMIEHINNKLEFVLFFRPPAKEIHDKIMGDRILHKGPKREPIEQLLFYFFG